MKKTIITLTAFSTIACGSEWDWRHGIWRVQTADPRVTQKDFATAVDCYLEHLPHVALPDPMYVQWYDGIQCGSYANANGCYWYPQDIAVKWQGESIHDSALAHEILHATLYWETGNSDALHAQEEKWAQISQIRSTCRER